MKGYPLRTSLSILLLFSITLFAAWRPGEMKVKIPHVTPGDVQTLRKLNFEIDFSEYPALYLYVIPAELQALRQAGFQPEIIIPDMTAYAQKLLKSPRLRAYKSFEETRKLVDSLIGEYPGIISKTVYGYSVEGRELFAVKISDHVRIDEPEPEIGFEGGHHGDEVISSELLVQLMKTLCEQYGIDSRITRLINTREIWIFPFVNPDGRASLSRSNRHYVDLNRDWGYMWDGWGRSESPYSQPETRACLNWLLDHQFVILSSIHAGAKVISYPWSYRPNPSPDHLLFDQLAEGYVQASGYQFLRFGPGYSQLYPINGTAKDSYYGIRGALGWTVEISPRKMLPYSEFLKLFRINLPGMLYLIEMSGKGISGQVRDAASGKPIPAIIWVESRNQRFWQTYSSPVQGDFHKYLPPGDYRVRITANGYQPVTFPAVVVTDTGATRLPVKLHPAKESFAYQVIAAQIPGNNYSDAGLTSNALAAPDSQRYSLGKNGWILLDMGRQYRDAAGNDLRVVEGDQSPEGFTISVAENYWGPWKEIGSGVGTSEFDLASRNIFQFRFIRIRDDGDGFGGIAKAGFDLDAVVHLSMPEHLPRLAITSVRVVDTLSNFNGRWEVGEPAFLQVEVENRSSRPLTDVTFQLTTDNKRIQVRAGEIFLSKVAGGEKVWLKGFAIMTAGDVDAEIATPLTLKVWANRTFTWQGKVPVRLHPGGRIELSPSAIAFNKIPPGSSKKQSITIQNTGKDTLKIFQLKTSTNSFQVENRQMVLLPGQRNAVPIVFQPGTFGIIRDTLRILCNDPLRPRVELPLRGAGSGMPEVNVKPDTLTLTMQPTDSVNVLLTLTNLSNDAFQFRILPQKDTGEEKTQTEVSGDGIGYVWQYLPVAQLRSQSQNDALFREVHFKLDFPDTAAGVKLPLAFSFPFLDNRYKEVRIFPDGWIALKSRMNAGGGNEVLFGETGVPWGIAPLRLDSSLFKPEKVVYLSDSSAVTIRWVGELMESELLPISFQVSLYADGLIEFRYDDILPPGIDYHRGIFRVEGTIVPSSVPIRLPETVPYGIRLQQKGVISIAPDVFSLKRKERINLRVKIKTDDYPEGAWRGILAVQETSSFQILKQIPFRIRVRSTFAKQGAKMGSPQVELSQNFPNPFNPVTTIRFQLPEQTTVRLVVYNTLGQTVKVLVNGALSGGEYRVQWDGTNEDGAKVPSGIYFYELRAGDWQQIRKMILLR